MAYSLRDRPDGQFEIVALRPVLIGIFPERDLATRVMFFLKEDDQENDQFPEEDDHDAAVDHPLPATPVVAAPAAAPAPPVASKPTPPPALLPAVVVQPKLAVARVEKVSLSEAESDAACTRIEAGEKIALVAPDFGLSFYQLRGIWANRRRRLQQHLAEAGPVRCVTCGKEFIPSITHPDTCARCSHEG